jgi:integrase/recombinase XerC
MGLRGRVIGPASLPITTETAELLRLYRTHERRKGDLPSSIEAREARLKAFARWIEPRELLGATRQDVERFLDKRRTKAGREITSRTRYCWIAHLHGFFAWALDEELVADDPTRRVVRPKQRRTLPRPIRDDDLVMAIRSARPAMRAMLSLAAFAGLRAGEIAGIERDDVLEAKGLIRVRHGKGDKERIVPLHPDVLEALRVLPMPKSGALFLRARGGRYSPNWLSACCSRYLHEMGIDASAHQLRHWFATEVYATTHDIRVTQELLGHSSPTTTAGYIAYSHVDAAAAVGALRLGPLSA